MITLLVLYVQIHVLKCTAVLSLKRSQYTKQLTLTIHLNKVEELWFVLLGWCQRAQNLVDVSHPPHCGPQQGWSGTHTCPQDIQQVPHTPLVELQGKKSFENPAHTHKM